MPDDLDARVRTAAFNFLDAEVRRTGSDLLPRALLAQGFGFDGRRDNVGLRLAMQRQTPLIYCHGVVLCTLHHAAFDANILGISPDYQIEIRLDVLEEKDGPMLKHGLQGFHRERLLTPRRPVLRPKREFLEERYALFKRAS